MKKSPRRFGHTGKNLSKQVNMGKRQGIVWSTIEQQIDNAVVGIINPQH
jgi:hypothetical protein